VTVDELPFEGVFVHERVNGGYRVVDTAILELRVRSPRTVRSLSKSRRTHGKSLENIIAIDQPGQRDGMYSAMIAQDDPEDTSNAMSIPP
jgi:hypothetical protein